MDQCILLLFTLELFHIRNKKKSKGTRYRTCHCTIPKLSLDMEQHHTEATGEKNQEKTRGGPNAHSYMESTGSNRTQECHGEGLASTDLPAKKRHWISSQPWLKAFSQSVKMFCSKQSHIILCSSTSRETLMESVLSTIMLLKIWIRNIMKLKTASRWKRCRKEPEITIIVSLSQANGEPIHSKYRVHKKPLFLLLVLSGST